jgi:hypothetical protein
MYARHCRSCSPGLLAAGLLAAAALWGCGGRGGEARDPVRRDDAARPAPAQAAPDPEALPARATRFSPGRANQAAIPAELAGFCQLAERQPRAGAKEVDTLALPRSPRSLVGMSNESSTTEALRCVVRTPAQWDLARSRVLMSTLSMDQRRMDFGREMLVVASSGGNWSMFSQLWIDGSWSRGDTLVVAVRQLTESINGTGSRDASPSAVVSVPRVNGPVFFIER